MNFIKSGGLDNLKKMPDKICIIVSFGGIDTCIMTKEYLLELVKEIKRVATVAIIVGNGIIAEGIEEQDIVIKGLFGEPDYELAGGVYYF